MITALAFLNEFCDRVGYPQIDTIEKPKLNSEHRKSLRLLNRILKSVGSYNDWPLLRKDGEITTVAAIEGDSDSSEFVTATNGSRDVTIDNAAFDETMVVYRVKTVTSPTTITLNKAWVGTSITAADELTYTLAMDRYALPDDFDRPVDSWESFFTPNEILPVEPNEFAERRRNWSGSMRLGDPEIYTLYGLTDNQAARIVHFDPYVEDARILTFAYQQEHPEINSDQDMILYPNSYIGAFMDIMIQLADRDYENNAKMQVVLQDALRKHNMQQSNPGVTDSRPILTPANSVRRTMQFAYGLPTATIDWGDAFDNGAIFGL
jgi:hypothetical protein